MFDCGSGPEDCTCHCHRMAGVKHFAACCVMCPTCNRHIRHGMLEFHMEKHNQDHHTDMVQ